MINTNARGFSYNVRKTIIVVTKDNNIIGAAKCPFGNFVPTVMALANIVANIEAVNIKSSIKDIFNQVVGLHYSEDQQEINQMLLADTHHAVINLNQETVNMENLVVTNNFNELSAIVDGLNANLTSDPNEKGFFINDYKLDEPLNMAKLAYDDVIAIAANLTDDLNKITQHRAFITFSSSKGTSAMFA